MIKSFLSKKSRGQGMVEYALILMLVGVVVIVALSATGMNVSGVFAKVNSSMAVGGNSSPQPTLCSFWGGGGQNGGGSGIVLIRTTAGNLTTDYVGSTNFTNPASANYNATILDTLQAHQTLVCP